MRTSAIVAAAGLRCVKGSLSVARGGLSQAELCDGIGTAPVVTQWNAQPCTVMKRLQSTLVWDTSSVARRVRAQSFPSRTRLCSVPLLVKPSEESPVERVSSLVESLHRISCLCAHHGRRRPGVPSWYTEPPLCWSCHATVPGRSKPEHQNTLAAVG
eukprot:354670-Chlamydomonas_euryale.AAC.4